MTGLWRQVFHDCQKPTLADPTATYRWTCPVCQSTWDWMCVPAMTGRTVRYGFLWLKTREDADPGHGGWMADLRTSTWKAE
jgi:hypothetical protein